MNFKHKECLHTLIAVIIAVNVETTLRPTEAQPFHIDSNLAEDHLQNHLKVPNKGIRKFTAPTAPNTTLDDVFISVRTTKKYHTKRLPLILKTWFQLARKQTWFFTDTDDMKFQSKTNSHMINTKCLSSHSRKALCCKISIEFQVFLKTGKKWFCHFDDDNYVNVPRLVRFLGDYNPRDEWYFGKPSRPTPVKIVRKKKIIKFWFGTGGAGFCISRALADKMMPFVGNRRLFSMANKLYLNDDMMIGFIIKHLLKQPLTVIYQFHSHLEPQKLITTGMIKDQISFSYTKDGRNVARISGFSRTEDRSRFLSIHCFLFPYFSFCHRRR